MPEKLIITANPITSLPYSIALATGEGWNPGLDDHETFACADSKGFFLGQKTNQPIACGSAVCYDQSYAFLGLYIVQKNERGKGYGIQLWNHMLDYVGERCVGLDGVLENETIYEQSGFVTDHISERHLIRPNRHPIETENEQVMPVSTNDLHLINQYDQMCFPAKRQAFLQAWVTAPHASAFYYNDSNGISGYIVLRKCIQGYKIGPLFADNPTHAEALLNHALVKARGESVMIDVPSNNRAACELIKNYRTTVSFACNRMYRNGKPDFKTECVYGITTFELG